MTVSEFDIDKEIELILTTPDIIPLNEIPDGLLERVKVSLQKAVLDGRKLQREKDAALVYTRLIAENFNDQAEIAAKTIREQEITDD